MNQSMLMLALGLVFCLVLVSEEQLCVYNIFTRLSGRVRNKKSAYAETKAQTSFAFTTLKLISVFVFATQINPSF